MYKSLQKQLITLGSEKPRLQRDLRAILDHLTRQSKRPQALRDVGAIRRGLEKALPALNLGKHEERDRGDRLIFYFTPHPRNYEVRSEKTMIGYDAQHRAFPKNQIRSLETSVLKTISEEVNKRGYHVSYHELKSERRRSIDWGTEDIEPNVQMVQTFMVEIQAYYPKGYYTPMSLINKGTPYLYHVTDQANVKSIQSRGLIPSGGSSSAKSDHGFLYPDRVYLFRKRQDIGRAIGDFVPQSIDDDRGLFLTKTPQISIIMVDLTEVGSRIKFYDDPSFPSDGAIFTYTHIPSQAIKRIINRDMSR